ncbi:MAG: hypothetical protein QXD03_05345 [Candidatus Anstonellales archaeon]
MISSLIVLGKYNIELNNNKVCVGNVKIGITEISAVRYRLGKYGEDEVRYIKSLKSKFIHSLHIIEQNLSDETSSEYRFIKDNINDIAMYLYIDILDEHVMNKDISDILEKLNKVRGIRYDRVMLLDKSTTLDVVNSDLFKYMISKEIGISVDDIGICSSPLSFINGNACLTAIKARELSALYTDSNKIPVSSSNHECMNSCGCIRYIAIDNDINVNINCKAKNENKIVKKSGSDVKDKNKSTIKKNVKVLAKW